MKADCSAIVSFGRGFTKQEIHWAQRTEVMVLIGDKVINSSKLWPQLRREKYYMEN